MTKRQLIDALRCVADDAEIRLEVPSGDYWGTHLAMPINDVGEATLLYTAYHNCFKVVDEDYDMEDEDPDKIVRDAVLLSS